MSTEHPESEKKYKMITPNGKVFLLTIKNLDKIHFFISLLDSSSDEVKEPIDLSRIIDLSPLLKMTDNDFDSIFTFIFQYASLYPEGKVESPEPEKNFKHRNISTLLEKNEVSIFHELINYTDDLHRDEQCFDEIFKEDLYEINILIKAMKYAELLNIQILFKKLAAVIAMYLKDKNISYIHKLFTAE